MKKIFLGFLAFLVFISIFSFKTDSLNYNLQNNEFTIEGEIIGLENNNLYYRIPNKNYENLGYWADSVIVKDNKFSVKGTTEEFGMYTFSTKLKSLIKTTKSGGFYPVKSGYLLIFVYPGANIKVTGKVSDFMDAYPSGDTANDDLGRLHQEVFPFMNEGVNYSVKASFEEDATLKRIYTQKADSINSIVAEKKKNFIFNNPSSIASWFYLSDMMMRDQLSNDEAVLAFEKMEKEVNNNPYFKEVSSRIKAIDASKIGRQAPEIKTTSTLDGKEFDLTSYKGKYVLIDFWGIWCGPCVSEMPKVKEFSEKYKGKLEILGVNSGDKKEKIASFIEKNGYKWQQVMDNSKSETDNIVLKYNISAFPTKFILDPEGKIIKKYVGSGEEAFLLLEELLK